MLTKKLLLGATAATFTICANAAHAETLQEAAQHAYENNPRLEVSRAVARASDEQVTQAEAAYGPSLNLTARHTFTYTRTHIDALPAPIVQQGFGSNAQVSLSQPLFTSGRLAAGVDSAEASALSAREEVRDATQQLLLDVIGAYLSVRRDAALYGVASETYELLLQQRNLTLARLNLRDATAPDVDQTSNRLELAAGQLIASRSALEVSAAAYRSLVGSYPEDLAAPPPLPPLPTLEELYASAEVSNPRILSQRHIADASRAQLAGARAARGPQVTADVNAGRLNSSPYENTNYSEQVTAEVRFEVPLYSSGRLVSRVREGIQRSIAAEQSVEDTRRQVRELLASDWNRLHSAEQELPRYQAAVAAAQRAVEGVKRQETAGIRTLRDVLDVTNDLFNARTAEVRAQVALYFRHASVLSSAGLLTIDMLGGSNAYDPDSYDPALADLAGMPSRLLIDPIDRVLLNDWAEPAGVEIESDNEYEPGERLVSPLVPPR